MKYISLIVKILVTCAILAGGYFLGVRILRQQPGAAASGEHGEASKADYERGPHGGRMLRDGDFAVEITIYEPDIPPQSRIYPFFENKPLDPDQVKVTMELHRFGTRVDAFTYKKEDGYLVGSRIVDEPHSFDVKVSAEYQGRKSSWAYDSYEGRVKITEQAAASVDLKFDKAGPRKIRTLAEMTGRIIPNEDEMAKVTPRFPGIVTEAGKKLGDTVQKGDVLAVIESNQSMTTYEVTAPMSGTIIARDVSRGVAVTNDKPIYTIADLSSVWVELNIRRADAGTLEKGQEIDIHDEKDSEFKATAKIAYFSPFGSQETQTVRAIAALPNPDGKWIPGLFVHAERVMQEREVPVAVRYDALQTFRDWDVVFMKHNEIYEIAILELGERDGDWVEVVSGLEAGTTYVTDNAFVVKADVLKSGASHDH
jgi:cobalt-zinc-cadmium efflux system membrane fusion protein